MKDLKSKICLLLLAISYSCSNNSPEILDTEIPETTAPNILLVIADDLGKDAINGFSEGLIKPNTPNIDALLNSGLSFSNFWTNPTCTPTRASMITGKYGYRTGVKGVGDELPLSEMTLQTYIKAQNNNNYATALVGKWHLSGRNASVNPENYGIDYYAGLIPGAVDNYYQWQLNESGNTSQNTNYITEVFTDLAINWINQQTNPWFMWLAYNAPHTPFHVPPNTMHSQGSLPDYTNGLDPTPYYMAAIEAMDFQLGRLLDNLSEDERNNTVIIFMGDNGTPSQVAQSPYSSATVKNTLYQGGINVPLCISGNMVSRTGIDDNLIISTDLFATIAEISGSPVSQINDSKSFKSLFSQSSKIRDYQYSELVNESTDAWAISNGEFKLIENALGAEEFYNVVNDPYENTNLLDGALSNEEQTAKLALEAELTSIRN